MRTLFSASTWWPGGAALCRRGQLSGLAVAAAFGLALDALLLLSFVWTGVLAGPVVRAGWVLLAGAWILALVGSWRTALRFSGQNAGAWNGDLFKRALDEYLRGNWLPAEQLLGQLVSADPRDAEARLLLATLLRRTGRFDEAQAQIDRLSRLEAGRRWQWEIAREREQLIQAHKERVEAGTAAKSEQRETSNAVKAA